MNLILLGYMASGKSRIAKSLANTLNYDCIDLDDFIEEQEGKSISDIFKDKGELYFRKIEQLHLKALVSNVSKTIISLGGGTVCYYDTIAMLNADNSLKTIYLQVSIPVLVERLEQEKAQRPLIAHIKSQEQLTEFIGKHLFERLAFYSQAQLTINANASVEEVVESILLELF